MHGDQPRLIDDQGPVIRIPIYRVTLSLLSGKPRFTCADPADQAGVEAWLAAYVESKNGVTE